MKALILFVFSVTLQLGSFAHADDQMIQMTVAQGQPLKVYDLDYLPSHVTEIDKQTRKQVFKQAIKHKIFIGTLKPGMPYIVTGETTVTDNPDTEQAQSFQVQYVSFSIDGKQLSGAVFSGAPVYCGAKPIPNDYTDEECNAFLGVKTRH